jgi:hypothetical protein
MATKSPAEMKAGSHPWAAQIISDLCLLEQQGFVPDLDLVSGWEPTRWAHPEGDAFETWVRKPGEDLSLRVRWSPDGRQSIWHRPVDVGIGYIMEPL